MSVKVTNDSGNYIGRVIEIDHYNKKPAEGDESEPLDLQPGETKEFYLHDGMSIRVEEVEEIKAGD